MKSLRVAKYRHLITRVLHYKNIASIEEVRHKNEQPLPSRFHANRLGRSPHRGGAGLSAPLALTVSGLRLKLYFAVSLSSFNHRQRGL